MNQMKDQAADLKEGEIRDKQETMITCFIDESMSETPPSRPSKNCAVVKRLSVPNTDRIKLYVQESEQCCKYKSMTATFESQLKKTLMHHAVFIQA